MAQLEDQDKQQETQLDEVLKPKKTKRGWKRHIFVGVLLLVALGVVRISLQAKDNSTQNQPPGQGNGQAQAQLDPSQEVQGIPNPSVIARNRALSNAIDAGNTNLNQLVCARADFYREQAKQMLREQSYPMDEFLMGKVKQYAQAAKKNVTDYHQLTGNDVDFAIANENVVNLQAALMAYSDYQKGAPLQECTVDQARMVAEAEELAAQHHIVRQLSIESELAKTNGLTYNPEQQGGQNK
jgi:hypothetical protein